jgi:hypothetical protein
MTLGKVTRSPIEVFIILPSEFSLYVTVRKESSAASRKIINAQFPFLWKKEHNGLAVRFALLRQCVCLLSRHCREGFPTGHGDKEPGETIVQLLRVVSIPLLIL